MEMDLRAVHTMPTFLSLGEEQRKGVGASTDLKSEGRRNASNSR